MTDDLIEWPQMLLHILQIPLLGSQLSGSLPSFQAGEIYQEFTEDGQVKNIIQGTVPYLLEEGNYVWADKHYQGIIQDQAST